MLAFLGYGIYTGITSWLAVRDAERTLTQTVNRADQQTDITERIRLYNQAYAAVNAVYAARDPFYRMVFGNPVPADALVLERNLEQALTDCVSRPFEECLFPFTERTIALGRDEFLRDTHRAKLVEFYTNIAELGLARDLTAKIEAPLIRAAVFEELGMRLANLGNREAALELAGQAVQAISEAEPSLITAVAMTQLAQMLINIGETPRAITLLQAAPPMIATQAEDAAALDKTLALLQIAATASLAGDVSTISATADVVREIDTLDSGPVPRARIEALLVADLARMRGVDAALTALNAIGNDLNRAFAQMLLAQNLALGGELIVADEVLQAGIENSQALGLTLPDELLVEVVGAQAALGYFPAAAITLSNIEQPVLSQEARSLLARYFLYADRDADANPIIDELEGTEFAPQLRQIRLIPTGERTSSFASVNMSERVLRFYRRSWKVQLDGFEQRLADRNVLDQFNLLATLANELASMPAEDVTTSMARDLVALGVGIREANSPMPVSTMLNNACQGQGPQCRVDIPYLQAFGFRSYILPALRRLNLAVAPSNG